MFLIKQLSMSRVSPTELCNICVEPYNKTVLEDGNQHRTGNKITCGKCNFSSCTHCTKRFILESNNDAHCMSCKHPWDREFMISNFTRVFINKEYKNHREKTLCEKEKALMPATMKMIERENEISEIHEAKQRFRREMEEKLYEFDVKIWNLEHSSGKCKKKNKFIKSCPVENCNGFLSSQWKCGICSTYTCKCCHEVIGKRQKLSNGELSELPEHTCNEDNVKTAMLLAKECKNCPKCAAPIYKIDGCNQMWCVECNTAFDWRTSEIITGNFHNPHYYEWVRQNNNGNVPRQAGDQPCGGNVEINQLTTHIKSIYTTSIFYYQEKNFDLDITRTFFQSLHRMCSHLTHVVISDLDRKNFLNDDNHMFNSNLEIRKKFLKSAISEDEFKKELQKKEKRREKALNLKQIFQTFVTVCNDTFTKIVNTRSKQELVNMVYQIITFINHINKQLVNHRALYSCVTWQFDLRKSKETIYPRGYYRNSDKSKIQKINVININHNSYKENVPITTNLKLFLI